MPNVPGEARTWRLMVAVNYPENQPGANKWLKALDKN